MSDLTLDQAQRDAVRTDLDTAQYEIIALNVDGRLLRLLHAAMGLCTEVGELQDQLKRHIFYGKPLDKVNLLEEGGDISWYLRILADELENLNSGRCSFEEMIARNIEKLKVRFPEKFDTHRAVNRDLDAERKTLE